MGFCSLISKLVAMWISMRMAIVWSNFMTSCHVVLYMENIMCSHIAFCIMPFSIFLSSF